MSDPEDDKEQTPPPWPEWVDWLLWTALVVGGVYLMVKMVRRVGAGGFIAAAAPAVVLVAGRPTASTEPIEWSDIQAQLYEIADHDPLIPPVQLFEALRSRGVPLTSEQHMARLLRDLGLRSEVRTVKGRTERRWYDLTEYANHG